MTRLGGKDYSEDTDKNNTEPAGQVDSVVGGTRITVDNTDPANPVVNSSSGQVDSIVAGTNIDSIDNTDPANPIINAATQGGSLPTTTKGDVVVHNGTTDVRLAVGTDGQVLEADSAAPEGVAWKTAAGGGGDPLTTKGDIMAFDTDANRLPVGTDGQVLEADSAEALGVKWATPAGGAAFDPQTINDYTTDSSAFSGSSNACKGNRITPNVNMEIYRVRVAHNDSSSYRVAVFSLDGSFDVVAKIAESTPVSASGVGYIDHHLNATLVSGTSYAVVAIVTGTDTTVCSVQLSTGATDSSPDITQHGLINKPNADPLVGESLSSSAGRSGCTIYYEYT